MDRPQHSRRFDATSSVGDKDASPALELPGSIRSPTSVDGQVGKRIKDLRRNQGHTQKDVAARVGVTGAQFHRYETGATRIAASRLLAIADALGVHPGTLMNEAPRLEQVLVATPEVFAGGDLVELVELFSSLGDQRRRCAALNFMRSLVARPPTV